MYGRVDWKRRAIYCQRGDYTATWRFMEKKRRSARGLMFLTSVNAREVRPVPLSLTVGWFRNGREDVAEYCRNARELSLRLPEAISESSLCLETDYINKALSKHEQHMAINYYPPCPQPELTKNRYRSVFHRAVMDGDKERISIPAFYCPSPVVN
ncbi:OXOGLUTARATE/IRON-DEPENDENT DIOXYGENASE [Salix viminalis]|uniref:OXOGLUTARATE/IRON-DEPENDENT DIOXYGENASE n=1 Tax=Salix viminalis TaxID=40686 RepID=A0A9Q0NSL6_SALVM|nr:OXOGLUTARATE/IRON-DEPENDENT DIOXYGENASE [Salix viminalis]